LLVPLPLSSSIMILILPLAILPLVLAMPSQEKELVNEMLDLVDSSLDQDQERMGRVLMLSITLSLTSSMTETQTVTTTLVNSCVAGTFTECTTSTEAASSRALEHHNKDARELFPDAIVTKSNGNSVDISTILPSRVEPQGRSDAEAFLDTDGILGKTMQSEYDLDRDADDVAHEAGMWSVRKGAKTQVCGPCTRNPHIHLHHNCYGDGHGDRHSHLQCRVEHMHHAWLHICPASLLRERRRERIVMVCCWIKETQESQRSRRISLS